MIHPQHLLADLQSLLPKLEQDILAYSQTRPELEAHLQAEYAKAKEAKRTAEHFVAWREAQITQAAAAWVLTCVFLRFLEDNGLLEVPMLAGPAAQLDQAPDQDASQPSRLGKAQRAQQTPPNQDASQSALQQAKDRMTVYFAEHPTHAERDYLLAVFTELSTLPAMGELLERAHNPLWRLPLSADGAKALIDFFQRLDPETGAIVHDFTDDRAEGGWDTRFLGDLYQDLSESVRKRYALLQTPEFVERFILDYTLEPALRAFGLPGLKLIDPTCGSGHFLLGAFQRLFADWQRREPATNARALAQRALDAIHGVDINPYAVAIARFRLLIAAIKAANGGPADGTDGRTGGRTDGRTGCVRLKDTPDFHLNLAVGDSLLLGPRHEWQGQGRQSDLLDDPLAHCFEVEDRAALERILGQRYPIVVGNPPYITVKDKALNQAYRDRYPTCHRQYSLGVPFTERFFDLTLRAEDNRPAGFVGMITANSFMKREFGKKLIENYLPRKDLTHVIDTSGAYIPGHGTPTVILFGRNRRPEGERVRAVLGIRGEPSTPEDAAQGKVWRSIVERLERPGSENEYVSVVDQERGLYARHPWSVGGGGASELKELIESAARTAGSAPAIQAPGDATHASGEAALAPGDAAPAASPARGSSASRDGGAREAGASSRGSRSQSFVTRGKLEDTISLIGFVCMTRADDVYFSTKAALLRLGIDQANVIANVEGDRVRDWDITDPSYTCFPYDADLKPFLAPAVERYLWPHRTALWLRREPNGNHREIGLTWFEWSRWLPERFKIPLSITFAEVATHNHFVLDRGGKVFKQTAPVIKLPAGATEDDHLALLGLLNSSTACFWMKQVSHNKGATSDTGVLQDDPERFRFAFNGTRLKGFPIPVLSNASRRRVIELTQALDKAGRDLASFAFPRFCENALKEEKPLKGEMTRVIEQREAMRSKMVRWQEELDWLCYELYGLIDRSDPGASMVHDMAPDEMPPLDKDSRLYRRLDQAPSDEKSIARLRLIKGNHSIALIERPEYKRRWFRSAGAYDERDLTDQIQFPRWMREWLLDHLETHCHAPELLTVAQLAEHARHDAAFQQVAALYTGSDTFDARALVAELVEADQVPQMAAARLKPKAMPKFRAWQETWDQQRAEDAIDARTTLDPADPAYLTEEQARALKASEIGDIPLPPKYAAADFRKSSYWALRGKLDVPKERFFSLPGCERPGDTTLVIGWAGLDHLQRAQAIAAWYLERKEQDGWDAARLRPMLVALDELIPWLKQWHNALDPEFGERLGDYYAGFLLEELRQLELSRDDLLAWEPAAARRGRGR